MPVPKLIFFYTYGCGGLGDLIKGMASVWWIAQKSGREFSIEFRHELGVLFPDKMMKRRDVLLPSISLIDKRTSGNLLDLLNSPSIVNRDVLIACNGDLDHFTKYENYAKQMLPFFQKVYTEFLPIRQISLSEKFQVLHCRMGDVYLNEATNRSDNRIGGIDVFNRKLDIFKRLFAGMRTLICCDSKEYLQELLATVPNSFSVCKEPYHFAYNTRKKAQSDIIESIRETLAEHELMSRGDRILMMVYSGFPIIASLIGGGSPIFLLDESAENGCRPYKNDWIMGLEL